MLSSTSMMCSGNCCAMGAILDRTELGEEAEEARDSATRAGIGMWLLSVDGDDTAVVCDAEGVQL